jgi:hypothetical protein
LSKTLKDLERPKIGIGSVLQGCSGKLLVEQHLAG